MGNSQGFSVANGVNVVVSNHRSSSESGSGAWSGSAGETKSYVFAPSNKGDATVMLAELPVAPATLDHRATGGMKSSPKGLPKVVSASGEWAFGAMDSEVCSGEVCCTASAASEGSSSYVLAAIDGTDTSEGSTWGAQTCAVLPCTKVK